MRVPVDPLVEDPLVAGDHRTAGMQQPGVGTAGRVQVVPEQQGEGLRGDRQRQLGEHRPASGGSRSETRRNKIKQDLILDIDMT